MSRFLPPIHPEEKVPEWDSGDVVRLDTGEVCGYGPVDVENRWVLLNDTDSEGEQIYYEDGYVEAHHPVLLVRDGQTQEE